MTLWLEKMLHMISILLSLLRLVFCPNVICLGKCSMCMWKSVYFVVLAWDVLQLSIKLIWTTVTFKTTISLLIFCLDDLSIHMIETLKFPTFIELLWISPFMFIIICFIYLGALMFGAYLLTILYLVLVSTLSHYVMSFFVFLTFFFF